MDPAHIDSVHGAFIVGDFTYSFWSHQLRQVRFGAEFGREDSEGGRNADLLLVLA